MLEHIIIIIGKLLWLLFLWVFLIFAYPITILCAIFGVEGSWEEVRRSTPYFLMFGLPAWVLFFGIWYAVKRKEITDFIAWVHCLFVPHRAEEPIRDAVRTQKPIDTKLLAERMKRKLVVNPDDLPAQFKSKNQAAKAEELATFVEADRKLMEAVAERERALRALRRQSREN